MNKDNNLKIFFIKLISITIAIIIIINVLFNLVISNVGFIEKLVSFSEVENRKEHADELRNDLNKLLEKDSIIKEEDRILLYKLYKKLKSEFKEIE
tara:strand:- start:1137 stop:1424 length:288 start_codon:yes stop_codon:yes gene_type:complete